jgi:hypothetical protein
MFALLYEYIGREMFRQAFWISHTVQALTGHAPQTLTDYVRQHPESYQHVTATRL